MSTGVILDGIRVASPCPASWDEMQGDDRSRFCSTCDKHVYNIAAMTTAEALALVREREGTGLGSPCVRLYRRADGTTITADCPVGAVAIRRGRLRKLAGYGMVALAMAAGTVTALGFLAPKTDEPGTTGGPQYPAWVERALVHLGLRKPTPPPSFVLGKICFPTRSSGEMISADEY